ncbi:hypothetical protein KDA_37770 [Dictyobacter alpinus]|uniref:ArnT-like N-terminal domain-containing protein n=1 Tax=Dictyobacter alpinus TaxID=2014873 RepID=A0A402BA77_9CHLR|nr:glycosyltransferase family 39 protein [Dictyobacter alpinus]GCE28293.1 hypothetical protein KDA_37770 [Dictyobacter alpinus]
MMGSSQSNQQGPPSQPVQGGQPAGNQPPQPPIVPGSGSPGSRWIQSAPEPEEKNEGNVTLFRTGNFFVHIVSPLLNTIQTGVLKTGALRTGTSALRKPGGGGETILERIRWTSVEKDRLMAAQTRLLPQAEPINTAQWREIAVPTWLELLVVLVILALPLFLQASNMFNYPAYTADEGSLMSNAWAILHGKIEPYAYSYDHPPIGWLLIAIWTQVTGGITSFGNAINSGRVLMLVLAAASSLFLYLITSRVSGSRSAALLAMLIYSLSPLSLLYRREVLLDNIGMFWLLLTLALITAGKSRLSTFVLAAVTMGLAVLSQEAMLLFLPVVLYAVWLYATEFQRKFSMLTFLYIALAISSVYVLLALLQGQLLPSGLWPGDTNPHPDLITALLQKLQPPLIGGQFRASWNIWVQTDWLILAAGIVAMFMNILGGTVRRLQLLAALLVATYTIFLLVLPVVYPTSIVPLLPFLALNIAMALNAPLRWLTTRIGFDLARALLCFIIIGALIPASIQQALPLQTRNTAQPQQQAMLWIRNNVPRNAVLITNSYMFTDLREPGGVSVGNGTPFSHAQIYSSIALDPEVANVELKGDWQQINFLVVDSSMLTQIRADQRYALLNQALHHGIVRLAVGSKNDGTLLQIYEVIRA